VACPASEQRALGWLSFEYDTSGELYWQTAKKLTTAWTDQYFMGGNGDGTLFYPGTPSLIGGTHGIPIESIRLKRIRDGREDYEYLRWLADHGQSAVALGATAGLFGPRDRAMYSANVPESALLGARTQLATAITAVVGTGVDLDPPRNPALASLSHRVAVWSPSRAVQVTWSGASDPSGVAGYSITWSADPTTVPDETIDSGGTSTTSPALPDGEWWFHLRTRDGAGNWSAPVHLGPFFVDGTPPQTRILRLRVRGRRARLTFAASEPADFACALDRGRFASCRSPRLYRRLRRGRHVFRVRARDRAGNVDATPARRAWKVK
jgi:hypothetical protein